ncbi:MAG: thioredoxin-disulfide reductase [Candidatus Hydrogenedentes bacterium]|nr:thioredoxin-disulfide reductase [Candidatus Hydrogenedentota bacterium]
MEKVIIIGSGPAGYTAALYSARANLSPLLFEGELSKDILPGGQLMTTTEVENYPGFPEGVTGPEMMELFKKQAERFGARIESKTITSVDFSKRPFTLVSGKETFQAKSIIIATGATAKYLGLPSEETYMNRGVSACATCDGALPRFRNKPLVVVGGGDTAMEEAIFLTNYASKVHIVHRRDKFRASKIMADRAIANPKIVCEWNSTVDEVLGDEKLGVTGVRLKDVNTGVTRDIECTGYFSAIGHKPNTDLFKGVLDMDETGYLVTKPGSTYTNIDGVFAAGDVQDRVYRQAITAAGSGCMAAIDCTRWLEANEHE